MFPIEQPNILERIEIDKINKANSHQISTLINDVARLASAIGDLSAVVDSLLTRLQKVEMRTAPD
jgi:hypothetical protein